jgi:hypothetical protein
MRLPTSRRGVGFVSLLSLLGFGALASPSKGSGWSFPRRFPGTAYSMDDDEVDTHLSEKSLLWGGTGRELNLFDNTVDGSTSVTKPAVTVRSPFDTDTTRPAAAKYPQRPNQYYDASADFSATNPNNYYRTGGRAFTGSRHNQKKSILQPVTDWWSANVSPNIKNWPKIQCRIEPTTTLKIRKTFRPLKTIVRLSAHFNTQRGVWQFKSSWEDAIIGGKLTLAGRKELQLTKSWQLSVGPVEDLVTRLRLRAAVDLQTWKAYVRVGFRTERLSPINVMEGFSLVKQIPLDGNNGHVKLEVKANFALPEPEIEYSTETQRSLIGMGDIEVGIEELNLLLDY